MLLNLSSVFGQDILNREVVIHVKDLPVKNVLDQISETTGVYFTYAGNLSVMEKKVSLNIDRISLHKLLADLFYGEEIIYTCYSNQVILKRKPTPIKSFTIRGVLIASGSDQPVEFASMQFKQSGKGSVAAIDGKFEISATSKDLDDSIAVFCIGFEPRVFSVKYLVSLDYHKIYLIARPLALDTVEFVAKRPITERAGNRGIATGSLYLDTHGQQVALYIENRKNVSGRFKKVNFYLSGKGNTDAPFRIRIYGVNDSLGCPGEELLPDIIVVKPNERRGWFEVDISGYNIRFPGNGAFVAMEGVYPGDYAHFINTTNFDKEETGESSGEISEGTLDYGQRIGFNRFSGNNTWHYSVSNTWFQLNRKLFNVMISAEILVHSSKKIKIRSHEDSSDFLSEFSNFLADYFGAMW
ncbi:MAG: carboxypeptidase-like regulatory domain-containing protein [Bacteroidales bacterium]|nr:carboxypeptidase-like regulatory domain-containing protein [Bacteroidales bacterium]